MGIRQQSPSWLEKNQGLLFSIYCITAAFSTYFCMYAFRKPFSAGTYSDLSLWGIDYKILSGHYSGAWLCHL